MTDDLGRRLTEHYLNKGQRKTFAGRYYAYHLVYFEPYEHPLAAIEREKELKDWNRQRKEQIIQDANPHWRFYNSEIMEWPPKIMIK